MLVLSRRPGQRLIIGTPPHQIIVTVASIVDGKVRIGIEADPSIPVHREEVYKKIADGEVQP